MGKAANWHSASEAEWEFALRREAVIRPLAECESLTPTAVLEAAQVLNLGRSVTYDLIARYRRRPQTSTLLAGRKGRKENSRFLGAQIESVIQNAIHQFYLTRERPRIVDLIRDIRMTCEQKGLKPPNFRSVRRRLESLDPKLVMEKREGGMTARHNFQPVRASTRGHLQPLEVIQIDHTPVDVIVVDERDRLPIGRPWLSLAIDLATRTVPGLYVSLDPPSAISVALVLSHAVLPKDGWLADRELRVSWPVAGIPEIIHLDNAQEFQSEALVRGAAEYGIRLEYRPPGQPHFGGHIERLIGTTMGAVHLLPGTTFSNVTDKGNYPSEKTAVLTMAELDSWIALQIAGVYHQSVHSALHRPPIQAWSVMMEHRSRPLRHPASPEQFFLDFLPGERRMIRRDGIRLFNIYYWDNYLSPLAGRSQETMMIKYDPRNLSRVYLQDDEGRYWPIPYRDLGLPPISLWEHREAMKRLKQEGRQAVDERTIFDTILKQRKLIESARRTTRQRRTAERGRPRVAAVNTPSVSAEPEGAELPPFKVEEW